MESPGGTAENLRGCLWLLSYFTLKEKALFLFVAESTCSIPLCTCHDMHHFF